MKVAIAILLLAIAGSLVDGHSRTLLQTPDPNATGQPTSSATPTSSPTTTGAPTPTSAPTSTPTPTPAPTSSSPTAAPTQTPSRGPSSGPSSGPSTATPTLTPARTPASSTTPSPNTPNAASLTPGSSSGSSPTDADILYFAYNLEVFEADFYSCAAFGTPVSSQYLGGGPAPTGCQQATLNSSIATFAAELAREETAHVALLFNALKAAGVNPVGPQVDISAGTFNTAAQLATNSPSLNPQFNPYANDLFFLHATFLFEDLGVSAYLGALNSISNSSYRLTAAQIGATEAYHAALDRTLLYQQINTVTPYNLTVAQITNGIVSLENSVAQAPQIKYNIYNDQGSSVSNVDSNGLVPAASAQQVLRIVTLGAASGSGGGFFPNNLNGNVKN